ncbi:redoxin domain-containing protein [Myroides odoratimimus]|uniref:redoxin domain-containing protein n=1 Tax=Myroides odoratimimus TaxID=76832 RepID=UPI0038D3768B
MSLLLLVMTILISCQKKNTIEITAEGIPDHTKVEIFTYPVGAKDKKTLITGELINGKVTLENHFTEFDEAYLNIEDNKEQKANIFFIGEPGNIKITYHKDNLNNNTFEGPEYNLKFKDFTTQIGIINDNAYKYYNDNEKRLEKAEDEEDIKTINEIEAQLDKYTEENHLILKKFESDNKNNSFGMFTLFQMIAMDQFSIEEYKELFEKYSPELKQTIIGKKTEDRLNKYIKKKESEVVLKIGDKLPEFKALDTEGKEVTLASFLQGKKIVLIDIWASWCAPCRKENPNIVENYKKYHDKGLDILGYSIDEKKDPWLKAIEKDNLTWTHVSNLMDWKDPIIAAYGIKGVPSNFLVNNEGIILGINLKKSALGEKLEEVLKTE